MNDLLISWLTPKMTTTQVVETSDTNTDRVRTADSSQISKNFQGAFSGTCAGPFHGKYTSWVSLLLNNSSHNKVAVLSNWIHYMALGQPRSKFSTSKLNIRAYELFFSGLWKKIYNSRNFPGIPGAVRTPSIVGPVTVVQPNQTLFIKLGNKRNV